MERFKAKKIVLAPGAPRAERGAPRSGGRRCCCSSASPAWSCSSRAPTSPICSSRAARRAPARWRCGCRSAPAARQLVAQLLVESLVLAVSAASPACWSLAGRSTPLLRDAASRGVRPRCRRPDRRRRDRVRRGPRGRRRGCCSACSRRCTARARPGDDAARAGRSDRRARAGRRASALTLATVQIALSMALLVAAGLFVQEPVNVSRVDLGLETDNLVDVRDFTGAEWLHARAFACVVRARRAGAARRCRVSPA